MCIARMWTRPARSGSSLGPVAPHASPSTPPGCPRSASTPPRMGSATAGSRSLSSTASPASTSPVGFSALTHPPTVSSRTGPSSSAIRQSSTVSAGRSATPSVVFGTAREERSTGLPPRPTAAPIRSRSFRRDLPPTISPRKTTAWCGCPRANTSCATPRTCPSPPAGRCARSSPRCSSPRPIATSSIPARPSPTFPTRKTP